MKRRKRLKNKKEKERGVWEKETAEQYKNSQICKKESERKKHLMEGLLYDTTGSPIKWESMKYKFDIVYNDQEKVENEGREGKKKRENEEWFKVFDLTSLWLKIISLI